MSLNLKKRNVNGFDANFLNFLDGEIILQTYISGILANSIPTSKKGKERLLLWKKKIAIEVCAERKGLHDSRKIYAISLGMKFFPRVHGNNLFDIENFIKPILDGIAAGLFCEQNVDELTRFNFDDSNFLYLYIERLPDAKTITQEGVALTISIQS